MVLIIFLLVCASIILISSQFLPVLLGRWQNLQDKKVGEAEKQLDKMFIQVERKKLFLWYTITPLVFGFGTFFIFGNIPVAFFCGLGSFIFPAIIIDYLKTIRRFRFQSQLPDGIMIFSSSLKGGLSLLQAIEVLVEEMPPPISQEFGLVLRENKIGVSLEDSLKHLHERMRLEDLDLVINSLIVAKETGGDLTKVLARLTTTLRDNRKLKENIKTLTLQGRLQGIIMSVLPFIFVAWVISFNKGHFDIMLNSDTGKMLLVVAAVLQVIGMVLIHKFSKVNL
ncbi:MAG: type II secretion system F family protein [Candidatus Omnitrophota bacterium]